MSKEITIPNDFQEATIEDVNNAGIQMLLRRAYLRGFFQGKMEQEITPEIEDKIRVAQYELLRDLSHVSKEDLEKTISAKKIELTKQRRAWFNEVNEKLATEEKKS